MHPTPFPRDPRAMSRLVLFVLGTVAFSPLVLSAQTEQLDVGVRSTVTDKSHLWSKEQPKIPGDGGHAKLYGIAKVEEIKSDQRLVKPVDENYVTNLLIMELERNGFQQIVVGQRPEIVIVMSYGRGQLENPYAGGQGEVGGNGTQLQVNANGGGDAGNAPMQTINGAMPMQLYDAKTPGHEAKLQKASFEKLYIRVTAFDYPKEKDKKMKMLWKSVMVVDDPDHRDLNLVAAKMLEAGAPLFDKQGREPEIDVYKPLPTGRVTFGPPEVVGSDVGKKK